MIQNEQSGLNFTNPGTVEVKYGENGNKYKNEAYYNIVGQKYTENINYSIDAEHSDEGVVKVGNNGEVEILKPGKVTIKAEKDPFHNFTFTSASYTLVINQGEQKIGIEGPTNVYYNPAEIRPQNYTVSGVVSTGETSVSLEGDEGVAEAVLDENGNVQLTALGHGKVTIVVSNAGDGNYKQAEARLDVVIRTVESGAHFEKGDELEVTFNENDNKLTNKLVGIQGDGEVIYSTPDTDLVEVNPTTGEVTIKQAAKTPEAVSGMATITAKKAEGETYGPVDLSYTLKINKADQTIAFADAAPEITLGAQEYQQSAAETGTYFGAGAITYAVVSGEQNYQRIDQETGTVYLLPNAVGEITVQATKAADKNYKEATATYTLTVSYEDTLENAYTLSEPTGENGWYTGEVTITPAEGFEISWESTFEDDKWHDSLSYDTEGETAPVIYLRKMDGGITAAITVSGIKIDTQLPEITDITYSDPAADREDGFGYYNDTMTVTITAQDDNSGVAKIYYSYGDFSGEAVPDENGKISFEIEPQYRGQVQYYVKDYAGLACETVTSDVELIVDNLPPQIEVEWNDAILTTENIRYYDADAVATVTIAEANFFNGADVTIEGGEFAGEWQAVAGAEDTWMNTVTLTAEGDHVLKISCADRSTNKMEGERTENGIYTSETIAIDYTAPEIILDEYLGTVCTNQEFTAKITIVEHYFDASSVNVTLSGVNPAVAENLVSVEWTEEKDEDGNAILDTYVGYVTVTGDSFYTLKIGITDPVGKKDDELASFIVEMIAPETLWIEYSDDVQGEVADAEGAYGYYADKMLVTIGAEDLTSGVKEIFYNYNGEWLSQTPEQGKITFWVEPEYRGKVQYYAVDHAGNKNEPVDGNATLIVDTIAPVIDVVWSDAVTATDDVRYYPGDAVATVTITEANFFDGADVAVEGGEFGGAWQAVAGAENTWMNTVTLTAEGDHVLKISYADRSTNQMEGERTENGIYTSEKIVIDHTAPVISASVNTEGVRQYFNETQTVEITVIEKNFDASLVNINITAQDSAGADVSGNVTFGQWTDEGNGVHKIVVTFPGDANYDLNADCKDLADRTAVMAEQLLTVDKTAPVNLDIKYSQSILSQILSGVTFGYYDAPVTVTISTTDMTAGIDTFSYQYIVNSGVSSVNKGGEGTAEAVHSGNTYTASFRIPASVLAAANQFNGYITFTAVDRSGNSSTKTHQGSQTVIVDNISPNATVSYNEPYQEANGVSYYAGNINATIVINEANFDARDVVVTVTRNGASHAVNVAWANNSADRHTGTFTLSEDGDYVVSVSYTDKSGNQMTSYSSNQLTLDATAPTIQVSNIVANSANKDAEYGFVITLDDANLDVNTMKPVLQAVVRDVSGQFVTSQIDLGQPVAVAAGKTYTYTVDNLPEDALYTLSCQVMDMSGNLTNTAVLDNGEAYDEIQFSINRSGSAFGFGDEYTEGLVNQYYVYEVYNDVAVVEVNVDPIENYVVMLNGEELTEGVDYTTEQTSNPGEWSKRTYIISKDLFASEGEYSIVVSSKDKTDTTAYSDVKNLSTRFVVDQTAPALTISGLESGGRYQTTEQTVTVIPTDEGGCLNSLLVQVLDSRGNPLTDDAGNDISVRFKMSGEEFLTYLEEHDGMVTFTIPEGLNNQVQIICTDCAVKDDGTTNEYNETFDRVTVSQNQLVIFYANTTAFIGSIAGVLAGIFLIILLIKRKKDKKEDKTEAKA